MPQRKRVSALDDVEVYPLHRLEFFHVACAVKLVNYADLYRVSIPVDLVEHLVQYMVEVTICVPDAPVLYVERPSIATNAFGIRSTLRKMVAHTALSLIMNIGTYRRTQGLESLSGITGRVSYVSRLWTSQPK